MGVKEDLDIIDAKIIKLKVDYEQYFAKVQKREPTALKDEIDRLIFKWSNQPINNTALKFRYSTLVSKYSSYKQFWIRILRQIEEGTYERGVGAVIRTPEVPLAGPQKSAAADSRAAGVKTEAPADSKFKTAYQQYIAARKASKEPVDDITYEKFAQTLAQQTEKIKKEVNCADVELKIFVKDGKAKLNIVPVK